MTNVKGPSRRSSGGRGAPSRSAPRPSAYEMLKEAILQGHLLPGEQLVEAALAEWCKVSRTPIREALTRLEQDGLVDRSDRGMVVRERSIEEVLDIYEVRVDLEAMAGRVAAERRTMHDLLLLRSMLRKCESVSTSEPQAMVDVNRQFHRAVWRSSHNESLIDLLERLDLHLARYPETTLAYPGRWESAKREHTKIVDAIDARDGSAAYAICSHHFAAARDIRLGLYGEEMLSEPDKSRPSSRKVSSERKSTAKAAIGPL